jgi:signal transduction histidine kinase
MIPLSRQPDMRLSRLTGAFESAAVEQAFRDAVWKAWTQQVRATSAIAAFLLLAFSYADYVALGTEDTFFVLLRVRIVVTAYLVGLAIIAPRFQRTDWLDAAVMAGAVLYALAYAIVVALKYEPTLVRSASFVMIVLGIYLFLPNRLVFTAISGVLATAAFIAVNSTYENHGPFEMATFAALLVFCNILGGVAVERLHRLRRFEYASLVAAQRANERLEAQSEELRELARNLAEARDAATHANRAKSEFLAHMSHELRSPLNAVIGFSEIIKGELFGPLSPAKYREYVNDIHASGTHLLAVISDVLDLSKAEAGRLELHETVVEPAALINDAARLVRERASDAGINLRVDAPHGLPRLRVDERIVKQILLSLITNALKFTNRGGEVSVRLADNGSDGLILAVADTGIGIAQHDMDKVMQPYGRADIARHYDKEGTGLGLPLVKAMVELHDGTLEFESTLGIGTTVTVCFPNERVIFDRAA